MVYLILAVLALYVVQTFLPSAIMSRAKGPEVMRYAGGPRDEPLELTVHAGRAARALQNMNEALFVFLPLALLSVASGPGGLATWGAGVFLLARVAYVPAYIAAVGLTRSIVWTVGHAGLGMMAWAVAAAV